MHSPIITFTIFLLVILTVPPIFERLKLPGLVGLLVAGLLLGNNGLQLLDSESETIKLLSSIGKVYLMFVAGLEIDLEQFRKTKNRSIGFGFFTFFISLIAGIGVGRLFSFDWNASVLIGSLLASHTLLAYPIVSRLGVVTNEAVTVTIGGTIFTDTGALLVLAICVGIHAGNFTPLNLIQLLVGLGIYSVSILFGFDWLGKEFFRRSGDEQGNQFLFILLALFIASVGAQLVGVDKIVGAFLAGLAVNDVLGHSPVREKVEFVGSVLFIPCFFVDMGLLINIPAFLKTLNSVWLALAIIMALIGSKFLAALFTKIVYGYNRNEMLVMWSLSLPQVAATLAAALVGYQTVNSAGERLINEGVFNSVIVLMLVTAILGPLITSRIASFLTVPATNLETDGTAISWQEDGDEVLEESQSQFTVVVPIYNPQTQHYLIEMAALLARHELGNIIPLAIAQGQIHMDDPQLQKALELSHRRIRGAIKISQKFAVQAVPTIRIDDDVALGISRTSREQSANLVVMGWGDTTGLRARLFGNVIDSVVWSSHCPVVVTRLLVSPIIIKKILVPVKDFSRQTISAISFAKILADANQAEVVLLHICDRRTPPEQVIIFESQLTEIISSSNWKIQTNIQTIPSEDVAKTIIQQAQGFDLVILRFVRYRTAGGLGVSEITTQVIQELNCSFVMVGEPHS